MFLQNFYIQEISRPKYTITGRLKNFEPKRTGDTQNLTNKKLGVY